MDKYIVVTTLTNDKDIADKIVNVLLNKRLVAGSQISKVESKYWWNNKIEESYEYKIEFRTKSNLFNEIEEEIKKIHDYEVFELSSYEIVNSNEEFLKWIDDNTK